MKTFEHLRAALPIEDPAFSDYWEFYLRSQPAFTEGATIELTREQLAVLFKLAFLAGRDAALEELDITSALVPHEPSQGGSN